MSNSQQGARLVYKNAVKSLIRAGVDPRSAVLSQSYLRFEQAVSATKTSYSFGILQNDGGNSGVAQRPTENRLALQDSFYCSSVQILFGKTASSTDTAFPLYTYTHQQIFGTDYANLWNAYNSSMTLTVNNRQIVTAWDLFRHYQANQTQQIAAASATTALNQMNGLDDSACECEPNWVLIGSKNNQLTINLPNAITGSAATNVYFVVILRGVLAQNVTVVS
jgi:hypothetical protein